MTKGGAIPGLKPLPHPNDVNLYLLPSFDKNQTQNDNGETSLKYDTFAMSFSDYKVFLCTL